MTSFTQTRVNFYPIPLQDYYGTILLMRRQQVARLRALLAVDGDKAGSSSNGNKNNGSSSGSARGRRKTDEVANKNEKGKKTKKKKRASSAPRLSGSD